jgi:hypothetical protein
LEASHWPSKIKLRQINGVQAMSKIVQMPDNLTFGEIDKGAEVQAGNKPHTVSAFRTAKVDKREDWISQRRGKNLGSPAFDDMNYIAYLHRQGFRGVQTEERYFSPFLSVCTSWRELLKRADSSLTFLTQGSMKLVEFAIPRHYLFRPKPCAPQSKEETEWLYFDYPEMIGNWLVRMYDPPKDAKATLIEYSGQNNIPSNVPAHRHA